MSDTEYLYCINQLGGEDFITISFEYNTDYINIYNFNQEFDIEKTKHVAIDYTSDVFLSFKENKYTNTNALKVYLVNLIEKDLDRMTVKLKILEKVDNFDLFIHKRNSKIESILE